MNSKVKQPDLLNEYKLAKSELSSNSLTKSELDAFGDEIDQLKKEVIADLGQRDADYILSIVRKQRYSEISGRALIHFSLDPISWAVGVGLLSASKILENMEIGHNVMHGQYDWMNDPKLYSQTYEWDNNCDSDSWRRTHNYEHHTYTNIIGQDRDYGYGILRLSDDIPWKPRHLFNLITYGILSMFFQSGVGIHELEIEKVASGEVSLKEKKPMLKAFFKKAGKQTLKDYIIFPLLAGPMALKVIAGNALANLVRNLWTSTVIFCGHFTEDSHTFHDVDYENETRGEWYYRQILGSGNFTGGKWLHIMSGNLSYQIEHHMFPDVPAHRYEEMSPKVQEICKKYGIAYNTGSFWNQYKTVIARVARYSLPTRKTSAQLT